MYSFPLVQNSLNLLYFQACCKSYLFDEVGVGALGVWRQEALLECFSFLCQLAEGSSYVPVVTEGFWLAN